MDLIELADGGWILHDDAFLPDAVAGRYLSGLRTELTWEQKPGIFGRLQPRLTASYGDEGITYRYSGIENSALPWTPMLLEIKVRIEAVRGKYNYCLLNYYRTGSDSMGLHADDEPGLGNVIGSVSLGATRTFRLCHNKSGEKRDFPLKHGALLIMGGTLQQFWKHEVPKTRVKVGERINLTFREISNSISSPTPRK